MQRSQCDASRNMKNRGNMTPLKDQNNLPVTNSKDTEICNLFDKEFKIAVLRKLSGQQENIEGQSTNKENK